MPYRWPHWPDLEREHMKLKLQRIKDVVWKDQPHHTQGRLYAHDGHEICVTLELPWVDADHDGRRDRNVSRVAAGTYHVKRVDSPKHGDCFELQNVPDCDHSQIHVAALAKRDLLGCIGPGSAFGPVQYPEMKESEPGVTGSRNAFKKFMTEMKDVNEFDLEILDPV